MKTIEKMAQHCWRPMEEYHIKDDDAEEMDDWISPEINDRLNVLMKLRPNQFIRWYDKIGVSKFNLFLEKLRDLGLDIGKGNCEYGYRMPLLQDGDKNRGLIIFRRY